MKQKENYDLRLKKAQKLSLCYFINISYKLSIKNVR